MTQQPYYPPQYPQTPPQQGYPPQAPQPMYPAPPPQAYPQQGYPAPAPQAPAPPLATGTLDAYYSQPSAASGPSISWTDANRQPKPIGTSYVGMVARDVTNADVQQQTDFNTKAPLFYRDGRPKFAMKVPLKVQQSPEFPEGEATWYVKGQARDELVRAMAEAGSEGAPKAGAIIQVTLVQRRPSGAGLNPSNVVQVVYTPPGAQPGQAQQTAPVAVAPSPAPAPAQQPDPQYAQGGYVQQAPAPQPVQQYAPAPQQPVQQAAPPVQPQQQLAAPAGMSAEQAELLARLTAAQQQ